MANFQKNKLLSVQTLTPKGPSARPCEPRGENYKAQVDCSKQIKAYKKKASLVENLANIAILRSVMRMGSVASKYADTDIYSLRHCGNLRIKSAGCNAVRDAKRRFFSEVMLARPQTNDILVFDNISLLIPSLNNSHLSALGNDIMPNHIVPTGPHHGIEWLSFLSDRLNKALVYDQAWNTQGDIRNIAHLEESIRERRGVCKEYASMLYLLLKKMEFEDVSLALIQQISDPYKGHLLLRAAVNGVPIAVDPTWNKIVAWEHIYSVYPEYMRAPMHIMGDPLRDSQRQ